ncbi:MAG: crossover junction endodeoxyribonuclease RuvC [Filifactoraceae bacterium]
MIIVGIDPGYAIVGYGIVEYVGNSYKVLDYGAITTDSKLSFNKRLRLIFEGMNEILDKFPVDEVAIEELFFAKNTKTGIDVAQARGVISVACELKGIDIFEYTPKQVKQGVCGYGGADKRQVQDMVRRLLNLRDVPKPDDVADALAIAICHSSTNRFSSGFRVN